MALEQATVFKTIGVLKSGIRKKPVATGIGTKHRYRYLVRGHEWIINGKSIWIKPQLRGEGEFLSRSIGATEEAQQAAKDIEAPVPLTVNVPKFTFDLLPLALPAPAPEPVLTITYGDGQKATFTPEEVRASVKDCDEQLALTPARRSLVRSVLDFLFSLFR